MGHKQPAKPSYFFHGGFIDLGHVIAGAFERCGDIIGRSAEGIGDSWGEIVDKYRDNFLTAIVKTVPNTFMFSFYLFRLIFSAIVTPIVCFSLTVFQIAMLLAFFLITMVFFGLITLTDKIYCVAKSIVSHCPVCQERFSMPIYICPKCGAEHDRLRPGYYGIFKRQCNCGNKLPTTFFNGRQKLAAICPSPSCRQSVKDGGLHASWCFPIVGGASSGKTCYINMAMMSLEKNSFSKYKLRFEHEKNGQDEYEENAASLSIGNLPAKTQDLRLKYYQFSLTPPGATKQQISLCDVAGELFDVSAGGRAVETQRGFRFVNAFMLIIDPLSIPEYRNEVSKTVNLAGYSGGAQAIDDMLDTFTRTLQNIFKINAGALKNTDVAVVFTKLDIPGLDQKIGENAIIKNAPSRDKKARLETQNKLCEQFLTEYGETNFLLNLKSSFKSIQFFTCSALGHVRDGKPFTPSNVEEPFYWLIGKKSKVIDRAVK